MIVYKFAFGAVFKLDRFGASPGKFHKTAVLAWVRTNDKDESIGPNKILKDIALGLASNGIASLRYDKRSLVYREELKSKMDITGIDEEVTDDAVSAIRQLKKNPETKNSKIIVLGHSLGGMCAPRVASRSGKADAVVLMAANARPLEDLIEEQVLYLFSLDSVDREEQASLVQLQRQITRVKDTRHLKSFPADSLPLGLTAHYWQSLNTYDQLRTAQKLKVPFLVLQGKRDYQVLMKDFDLWKSALGADPRNTFTAFEDLNHLFIKGEGKSKPQEYEEQGNVEEEVIKVLAEWIKALR